MPLTATFAADLAQFSRSVRGGMADVQAFDRSTSTAVGSIKAQFSGLSSVLGAFGAALSVGAVVQFGKSLVDAAGHIIDLRNKTGLTTDTIQEMQAVAAATGTDLETFTQASFKLGVNIADGSKKATDALKDLGLSFTELRNASPDEQFRQVVKALEGIDNQQERNRIGMALFGKQFSEIAASIEDGYTDIADSAAKSTETQLEALDKVGDAWTKLQNDVKKAVTSMLGDMALAIVEIERGADSLSNFQKLQLAVTSTFSGQGYLNALRDVGKGIRDTDIELKNFEATSKRVTRLTDEEAKAAKRAGEERARAAKQAADELTRLGDQMVKWNDEQDRNTEEIKKAAIASDIWLTKFNAGLSVTGKELEEFADRINDVKDAFDASVKDFPGIFSGMLVPLKAAATEVRSTFEFEFDGVKDAFANTMASLPDLLIQSFTGGGGIAGAMKALGVTLANSIIQPLMKQIREFFPKIGAAIDVGTAGAGALGGALGGGPGAVIGSMAGALGGVTLAATGAVTSMVALSAATMGIGAAAVGVYLLGKHFFTVSQAVKEARTTLQGFQAEINKTLTPQQLAAAGGEQWKADLIAVTNAYQMIGRSSAEAAKIVEQMWDTDHPKRSAEAIAEVNRVLGITQKALAELNTGFSEWGQKARDIGLRLPEALLMSLERLREMGRLTEDNIALLDELEGAATVDWRKMEEAAGRYGDWLKNELGATFEQLKANDFAKQMINDFDLLTRGGASVGSVLMGMSDEISGLVQQALKMGLTLPENMKPWIEELRRAGLLVDAEGNKIEDLADLKFAEPIKTEFEIITEAIEKLIATLDKLAVGLTNIGNINIPSPTMPFIGSPPGSGGGVVAPADFGTFKPSAVSTQGQAVRVEVAMPNGLSLVDFVMMKAGNRWAVKAS